MAAWWALWIWLATPRSTSAHKAETDFTGVKEVVAGDGRGLLAGCLGHE